MTSILLSGYGRLHLAQSADWLGKVGVDVMLVCGWVPKNPDSMLVRLCSKIVGRNLAPGLRKRAVTFEAGGEVCSCAWVDFMCNTLFIMESRLFRGRFHDPVATFAWSIFGWQAKRFIRKAARSGRMVVLHVRSGAGQGGAIKLAKKKGMKVLVDHSALHPEQSEINLKDDCLRWGVPVPIAPHSGVWKNVLADCAEADVLMVNANHIRDSFVERGYDPEKIRVVYLGVRDDFRDVNINRVRSGKKNELPRVLFTGAFYLLKGAEYLLESLRILGERGVGVHYDVVGSVNAPKGLLEKYDDLIDRVEGDGIFNHVEQVGHVEDTTQSIRPNQSSVTFHGPVPQDDLRQFLADADIYLFPSLADGCAQSGMEALTAGLPVVATYQSGLPITDGETGYVVPMKNAEAIADKIEWLIAHPEERLRLGQNAAKMMRENYTWERYAKNVKRIYKDLMPNA